MGVERQALQVPVQVRHRATGWPFAGVPVEVVAGAGEHVRVVADGETGTAGEVVLEVDPDLWRESLAVRLAGDESHKQLGRSTVCGDDAPVSLTVTTQALDRETRAAIADHLVATRRVRLGDVAADLMAPAPDSWLRAVPAGQRARLLDDLLDAVGGGAEVEPALDFDDVRLIDPDALRDGDIVLEPPPLLDIDLDLDIDHINPDLLPGNPPIWDSFGWTKPDDESYRDYLRGVFVLFAHQQKLGAGADASAFPAIVERQLERRFFQDFRTTDHTQTPLNKLLIPLVTKILTAPGGDAFGFAVPAASVPAQAAQPDRAYLDALLALSGIDVDEFANRYRLPLREPDTTMSTPVKLNIHTLSRALSDTAQGPVEPRENVIVPQLPGEEGKPILWTDVVGSAPFFLRFDEWLARQQPFFAENLFAIRTQLMGTAGGPWLDDARKKFLEYHQAIPLTHSLTPYNPYFGSIGEVNRSAAFLLKYGAADAKLTEAVAAIDSSQFAAAARLVEEAAQLLQAASPTAAGSEDWEPEFSVGFPRPLSLARRRKMKVGTITELTGTGTTYPPDGFEPFFALARPTDLWLDVVGFRIARDQATRLRTYQQKFLVPMLRALVRTGLGDLPGAVVELGEVTGFFVGIGMLGTPAGMVKHPDAGTAKRVVAGRLRWNHPLGDRPYTARLMYDDERQLDGPFPLTPQVRGFSDALTPEQPILHPLEERYARLVLGDTLLAWAELLYRTDDAASLERARELYKAVLFLHGEDPGTSAYLPATWFPLPGFTFTENPRRRNQLDRARLALQQLEAGLNFYGYNDDAVPTLRYQTLVNAAQRWAAGAKGAQNDYLAYLGRVEQLDLDLLAAKAQERKAQATVAIAAEQIEIAKLGVVVAQKLVKDVERLIQNKQQEIADAKSLFSQFGEYFSGMKSGVSSLVDVGKGAAEGSTALGVTTDGQVAAALKDMGSQAFSGSGVAGGLGMVGAFAAFAAMSTVTLQGMADAATKRENELKILMNEALPAAQAAVKVQERGVAIAQLQARIAVSDLQYAHDLITYQNERFLNCDFWDALAGVARRSLHRYLDLAAQAAWFGERALAYQLATPIRVIRLGYFDPRLRDVGGVDRLSLDLAELEAVRLGAARVTVPITRSYSLARDLPLAFGELKRTGRCTFTLNDNDLLASHPGTYAHRVRAVDVRVDVPGTVVPARGILTNRGFSLLRRTPGDPPVPLLRFADAYPVSEFQLRSDAALHGMPGEQLLPFEGTAFTTTWTLELPPAANPAALARVTDVVLTFDLQAGYDAGRVETPVLPAQMSRAVFVSALSVDSAGLGSLRTPAPKAQVRFALDQLPLPASGKITNLAVLVPGVDGGTFASKLRLGGTSTNFTVADGLAMSNLGVLSDGVAANAQPLNAAVAGSPARPIEVEITKGADADVLARARDVLLWVEYEVTA